MTMTKEEIVRDYMQAKTPRKQIGILAELNACKKSEIVEILKEAGTKLPGNYYNKPPKPALAPAEEPKEMAESAVAAPAVDEIRALNEPLDDAVTHPTHYTSGGVECIEAIKASMSREEFAGYCKGNAMKYIWRYDKKNGAEDLRKAEVYLNWLIEAVEMHDL